MTLAGRKTRLLREKKQFESSSRAGYLNIRSPAQNIRNISFHLSRMDGSEWRVGSAGSATNSGLREDRGTAARAGSHLP